MRVRMERDHARPAIAFLVLVVLAAATVGSGLARQDGDTRRADVIAALPSTSPTGPAVQPDAAVSTARATTAPARPRRTAARSTPVPATSGTPGSATAPAPGTADQGRRSGAAGPAKGHPRPADGRGRRTHAPQGRR